MTTLRFILAAIRVGCKSNLLRRPNAVGRGRGGIVLWPGVGKFASALELESLEAVQCFFDLLLAQAARAIADPGPSLHQQLLPLAIGLEVKDRDDFIPDEHRLGEVAEASLLLGNISLETVLVVEEEMQPLALMDEGIEGRQDVHALQGCIEA